MNLNFDNPDLGRTCPKCSHKFKQRIGRLKNDPNIPCPACGASIHFDGKMLRDTTKSADEALANLDRDIGKLFT